ncbi:unnamed protein product [Pelagomonas calceolata]|uniref:Methyltransferase domain-containing protein n=1 Tax=Pelagomonas calceolata TaxID=35677 RepID=A0A7S4A844_9STRA|nr:unnamed protein product [Pelagomonas calceolata]
MPRLLLVVAATCCALQPHSALHPKAPRRAITVTAAELISETDAEALADVVAAALETDAVIDLRVNRGEADAMFKRVSGRVVELKNKRLLQLTYKRRGACDLQRNHAFQGDDGAEGTDGDLLPPKKWSARKAVAHALTGGAHAKATVGATRYDLTKGSLTSTSCAPAKKTASHDRTKKRVVSDDFLVALNVTNAAGKARPGMERKRKQILRFAELLDHTLSKTDLYASDSIRLVDEGCGKGYLTFAAHELLKKKSQAALDVVGVERRRELVDACNWACRDDAGLSFMAGDIAPQGKVDVVVALHACDTATDDALHAAVLGGARAIVAAPCCHKQLRPQLERHRKGSEADPALQAILHHGILADRHAEAVTDTMRCLALECVGYEARMVEWAPLDHTAKNTMLVATRADAGTDAAERLRALAAFHGVARQRLCGLLELELPGGGDEVPPRGRMPQE